MRQRSAAEFSDLTDALINRMERGGYAVSVFRMGDYVEMHAVQLKEPCPQHIATVWDGDDEEHLYRCTIELARMVGIDPQDGCVRLYSFHLAWRRGMNGAKWWVLLAVLLFPSESRADPIIFDFESGDLSGW